jgi:hypothetical protein
MPGIPEKPWIKGGDGTQGVLLQQRQDCRDL